MHTHLISHNYDTHRKEKEMKKRLLVNVHILMILVIITLAVLLSGCASGPAAPVEISPLVTEPGVEATSETEVTLPQDEPASLPGDYQKAINDFYAWYLSYGSGESGTSPLSDQAYRTSPFLSQKMIEKAAALLASPPEVWNSDPFVCAQILPPELHIVNSFANGERPVAVLSIPHPDYFFVVDMALSPEGQWQIDDIHCNTSAEGVITAFLVQALNHQTDGETLVDQIVYDETDFLADSYRNDLRQRLASGDGIAEDVLYANMTQIESFSHQPCSQDHCTRLDLQYKDDTLGSLDVLWQDDDYHYQYHITGFYPSGQSGAAEPGTTSPLPQSNQEGVSSPARAAFEKFYAGYLEAWASGHNPLVEGTYKDSPYVFSGWAQEVEMLAPEAFNDPFTCSNVIAKSLVVDAVVNEEAGAHILAHNEVNGQYLTAEMTMAEQWQIMRIICPDTPEGVAWSFYTWYLGYSIGEQTINQAPEMLRNPMADHAYLTSPFLTREVMEWAKATRESSGGDPFLSAQAFPSAYWVSVGSQPGWASVRLQFGPMSVRTLNMLVEEVNGHWVITEIAPVEIPAFDPQAGKDVDTAGWSTLFDEKLGFSLRYPAGWVVEDVKLEPGMSWEEQERGSFLMPSEVAAAINEQNQNQNPTSNPLVPTLHLEAFQASEEVFNNLHVTESLQRFEFNGLELRVEREYGTVRYVFRHPDRPDFWLVLIDTISEMQGREDQAKNLEEVLMPLLHSVEIVP